MDGTIKPPDPLSNEGDMAENWRTWKKDFIVYLELSDYIDRSQDIKAYLLRNYIGEVGKDAIQKLVFENVSDRDNMFKLIEKLDAHFNPINEVEARYNFFSSYRKQGESMEDYINDLKIKAETCNFGIITDSLIRDKVIVDLKDKALRKKLYEVKNLDLSQLISVYKEHAATTAKKHQFSSENANTMEREPNSCWRCNQRHPIRRCPAWNFQCQNCGENHHFTKCCRKKNNVSRTEQKDTNKYNRKQNESNHNTGNMQSSNTVNTENPSNMAPTAPSHPSVGNRIYPNLNPVYMPEQNMGSKQRNVRHNEFFQRSEAISPASRPHSAASMQTRQHKTTKKDDACLLS